MTSISFYTNMVCAHLTTENGRMPQTLQSQLNHTLAAAF